MPLKKGTSSSVVSSNIKTLVDDWQKDGSIGTSHPSTKKKAIKQAVAIALNKAARRDPNCARCGSRGGEGRG